MALNEGNPQTQEILISRENTAESESQLLGIKSNLEVTGEANNDSCIKIDVVKNTEAYKRKLLLTIWIFCAFLSLGLMSSEIGPSFLDLLSLTNSSLIEGSSVITAGSLGYFTGAICTGLFLHSFANTVLMFASLMGSAILNISMTWCPNLILLVFINFLRSFFCAILDTVGNTECVEIWSKESGPYMQSIHLGFALGGLLSPLIVKPFLSPTQRATIDPVENISKLTNNSGNVNDSMIFTMFSTTKSSLLSQTADFTTNVSISNSSLPSHSSSFQTQVHYAYLIIALISMLTAIPYAVNLFKLGTFRKIGKVKKTENESSLPLKDMIFPLLFILLVYMIYCGMEDGISVYLATFTVKYLNWTKQQGSMATFVFWICFAFGRFLGIFLLKIFNTSQMLVMDLTLLNICTLVLLWSKSLPILVWIFYGISGFAMASVFATGFTWAETYLFKVTARICSAILVFSSLGTSLNPVFLGFMMEKYSPHWFLYIIFGESLVCSGFFLILAFFSQSQYWQKKRKLCDNKN